MSRFLAAPGVQTQPDSTPSRGRPHQPEVPLLVNSRVTEPSMIPEASCNPALQLSELPGGRWAISAGGRGVQLLQWKMDGLVAGGRSYVTSHFLPECLQILTNTDGKERNELCRCCELPNCSPKQRQLR